MSDTYEKFKCDENFYKYHCSCSSGECKFGISYQEGSSYKGYYGKDTFVLGNDIEDHLSGEVNMDNFKEVYQERKIHTTFGCIEKETKLFYE